MAYEKPGNVTRKGENTHIIGLGFISQGSDGNVSVTDVNNGRLVRIRPLHYNWKYKPEEYRPWEIKARGKTFKVPEKSLLPPHSIASKVSSIFEGPIVPLSLTTYNLEIIRRRKEAKNRTLPSRKDHNRTAREQDNGL
ncbi:MAG TPA: hypothetical protein VMW86_03740 [Dehalococcoidales bacterium]|nr:hypothetical protein [Dehalococcoidales bacterium]